MKILQIFFAILLCATPLYAEQALVLTEIEGIQEKIWHLQRDLVAQKDSLQNHQEQLNLLATKTGGAQLDFNKRLVALTQATATHQKGMRQTEGKLQEIAKALNNLVNTIGKQNKAIQEQAGKTESLAKSLRTLQAEFAANQASTKQTLAEAHAQLTETRTKIDALNKDIGVQTEQIGLWGAGGVLILAIVLTAAFALRKSSAKKMSSGQKQPPRHEM